MKSPDKIKKALRCCSGCSTGFGACQACPYIGDEDCIEHMCVDARKYIARLELLKRIKPLRPSLRWRLWRLFHHRAYSRMKKIFTNLDEVHEYEFVHREPKPNEAIIEEVDPSDQS